MKSSLNSMKLDRFTDQSILVTGGAGYLATNLICALKNVDCHIIRLVRQEINNLLIDSKSKIYNVISDIREQSIWKKLLPNTNLVFHFAAQTSAYVANENPSADLNSNVVPMLHLLETCKQNCWSPIILFASTATIAGIPTLIPVDETYPDNPITIYDLHKLMAEQYLKWYIRQGIVRGAVLRLANVYGPGPESSSSNRGILNQMIRRALAGEPLTVYKPGDCLRDYIYVDDVVLAFLYAAKNIDRINGQYFYIGSGEGYTIANAINLVADRVALKTGNRVDVKYIDPLSPQLPIESRNFVANSKQFKQATGWQARCSLTEGIDRTIEAFL